MVLVTGQLLVDDGQNVLQYSQMFHVSSPCLNTQLETDMTARSRGTGILCPKRRFPIVSLPPPYGQETS